MKYIFDTIRDKTSFKKQKQDEKNKKIKVFLKK